MDYKSVSIIIQARSTSTRFPGKIFEKIGEKQILQHVVDVCGNSASWINAQSARHNTVCSVALAIPYNDPIKVHYNRYKIIEGPEDDVLKRYLLAVQDLDSDYVVRITSDCPFIPPFVITKSISNAIKDKIDYLTNADPRFRTFPDGHDVEVLSRRMLEWLGENANDQKDREHVTSYLIKHLPAWAKAAHMIGFVDLFKPECKLSVDTPEDLKRLTEMYDKINSSMRSCTKFYRL